MNIQAVFFDLGGVIVRTEFQSPRQHLAERLGMDYEDLERLVFESETSRLASLGKIQEEEHWQAIARHLHRPEEAERLRAEFFAGDVIDWTLIDFIRSLRPHRKTGLISNAWSGLREYIVRHKFQDAFDQIIISAEVGMVKPQAEIYRLAAAQLGVRPEESLFVDDFPANIQGAQQVGMIGILFRTPEQALREIREHLWLDDFLGMDDRR